VSVLAPASGPEATEVLVEPRGRWEDRGERRRPDTDLSYDVGPARGRAGDAFVVVSLEEARRTVDRALNRTVEELFRAGQHTARSPAQVTPDT
jgi:hypothetical protein